MNDIPIAVINGASRGAPRSGRYATRSTVALIRPHATIATSSEQTIARTSGPARLVRMQVEDRQDHRRGDHPAEHEHVAVREVDQLEDPVDERVAERDERVHGAVRQPDERDREEVRRPLLEVDREPEDERASRSPAATGMTYELSERLARSEACALTSVATGERVWRYTPGARMRPRRDSVIAPSLRAADQVGRRDDRLLRNELLSDLLVDRDRRQVRCRRSS